MLAQRLKELRLEQNLTQEDLSKKLNITRGTYAHYELGKREPSYETLKLISSFYKVSIDYLIGNSDFKNTTAQNTFKPTLTRKDEKDIAKKLEEIINDMNSSDGLMLYNDDLDDETKELLIASLERTLRQAKLIAKEKFTSHKYKK